MGGIFGALPSLLIVALVVPVGVPGFAAHPLPPPARPGALVSLESGGLLPSHGVVLPSATCVGEGKLQVNSSDPNASTNDGVEMNLTGFASGAFNSTSSFQVSLEDHIGAYDAVFGLFENSAISLSPFYGIFYSANDSPVSLTYWRTLFVVSGEEYSFVLRSSMGTNWSLQINGQPYGGSPASSLFDYGLTSVNGSGNVTFSEVAFNPSPSSLPGQFTLPLALGVHQPSGWYVPHQGSVHLCGAPLSWSVEGRLQHPTLAPDELVTGTQIGSVADGTLLWSTGPVPVQVSYSLTPPTMLGTSVGQVTASVTTVAGAPIPGVYLSPSDQYGGIFAPGVPITNSSGSVVFDFEAPNTTIPLADNITVASGVPGYAGSARGVEQILATIHYTLTAVPTSLTLGTSSAADLRVLVTNGTGAPASGVELLFAVSAAASLSPSVTFSDNGGQTVTRITAPPYPTMVRVVATVAAPGSWGVAVVLVTITPATIPSWVSWLPYAVPAGVAAAIAAALVVFVRRRRKARRPLPAFMSGTGPTSVPQGNRPEGPDASRRLP